MISIHLSKTQFSFQFDISCEWDIYIYIFWRMWMGYIWSSHKRNRALLHFIYVAIYVMNWCKTLSLSLSPYIYSLAVIVNGLVYLDSVFNSGPLDVAPLSRFGLMSSFPDLHCLVVESLFMTRMIKWSPIDFIGQP